MTLPNGKPPGHIITLLGFGLLAFSALWAVGAVLTGVSMCPAYVTLAQALLAFVLIALATWGRTLGGRKP